MRASDETAARRCVLEIEHLTAEAEAVAWRLRPSRPRLSPAAVLILAPLAVMVGACVMQIIQGGL